MCSVTMKSVFKNSTLSESTLKKKHNLIAYHCTHEAQAVHINNDIMIAVMAHDRQCLHA